jgi:hypothetical protein
MIVLSTSNSLGYSSYMGLAFIIAAGLNILVILILWIILITSQSKKFDYKALKWK